jgi:hypothetical protein
MSSSYYVTYGTDRLTFGGSGSVAWEYVETAVPTFTITFGENNSYSAGLTAEYNGQVVYSRALGTANVTVSGIPSGSKITVVASSPTYRTYKLSSFTGLSDVSNTTYDGQRNGIGATATAIITANASARLSEGNTKYFRVEGNWPKPGGNGRLASVYCRPTAFSSRIGDTISAGSKLNIRSSWTANNVSHQSNNWGAGGDVSAPGWQPRSVSGSRWSGWCDTTGTTTVIYGYLESAGGFQTFGGHNSSNYIARSWGETPTQNFYCAGRSAYGGTVITAINGWWWATGIAP